MRWVRHDDGTYSVSVTRRFAGGRQKTFSYETPVLPMTARGAVGLGQRLKNDADFAAAHPEMSAEMIQRANTARIIGVRIMAVIAVIVICVIALAAQGKL